jgi:Zn-dependent peptidase ImmA (M78 family)
VASLHSNRGAKRAREAREALGLGLDGPLPDLLDAVEAAGAHVVVLELGGVAGAHLLRPGCPLLFVNGAEPANRQRFTLAHELGHHRLGHATVVDEPSALIGHGHDPAEVEANAFAAEFLLPKQAMQEWARGHGAIGLTDVVRLAATYGVSAAMVRFRLLTTGVLSDRRRLEALEREIAENQHLVLAGYLGLTTLDDRLAEAARQMPYVPAQLRRSPFGQLLAGDLDAAGLAARIGQEPAVVRRTLANLGLEA